MSEAPSSQPDRRVLYVVSPCFNEVAGIEAFYEELKRILDSLPDLDHRIVLVDDGSIHLATRAGLMLVFFGLLYLSYIVGRWWILGDLVPGWASVISIVPILGGAQMAFIGLIGEYLARVFDESKRRPLFLLKQTPGVEAESDPVPPPPLTTSAHYEDRKRSPRLAHRSCASTACISSRSKSRCMPCPGGAIGICKWRAG